MAAFVQENADMGLIALERGDSQLQLHIQGMLCLKSSSVRSLKEDIKAAIDWQEHSPPGASVGCLRQMLHSGQYIPALRWLVSPALSRERAETLWRAATAPETTTLTDVDHIFFARIPQTRYFEPKHPAEIMEEVLRYAEEQKRRNVQDQHHHTDERQTAAEIFEEILTYGKALKQTNSEEEEQSPHQQQAAHGEEPSNRASAAEEKHHEDYHKQPTEHTEHNPADNKNKEPEAEAERAAADGPT
ncbi:hypothetical protein R1sor_017211 [Riccia sorocarpa]|uniref:Uncharacterized protein n=1 Tax=Riccia sorocarpa TaxID=122646 RepID=A0ABD3I7Z2_9MARC